MQKGRYGEFGGQYVAETLMYALGELEQAYNDAINDIGFQADLQKMFNEYAGRPSLLYYAENATRRLGGAKIYLKREDLNHTGSHKINNVIGQALLAARMGKKKIIAETGAGQHGVASATAAALLGMECEVFMGTEDIERQKLNVFRMQLLGAKVTGVASGTGTLKDATSEAMRAWTSRVEDTFYVMGSVVGPHPYPEMVAYFQSVIGIEARKQILELEGKLPSAVVACVGGGSNAMGIFKGFINDEDVQLIGAEAAGEGISSGKHAAAIGGGSHGVLHGMKSYFVQDDDGNITPVYSLSAGLDYPGIGPEHAYLYATGRADYFPVTDIEAVDAFRFLAETEGIIAALESSHAMYHAMQIAPKFPRDSIIIVNLSGRGDKDVAQIAEFMGVMV